MSLMGTLAKVAVGVALAKGAGTLMSRNAQSGGLSGSGSAQAGGGLQDLVGGMLGGGGQSGGGLGGLLEGIQQKNPGTQDGGIDALLGGLSGQQGDLLGKLTQSLGGGAGGQGGGLGGLLGGLGAMAGGAGAAAAAGGGGFGDLLNQAMERQGEPEAPPTPEQDAVAGLMLRALIQAAMSDGKLDEGERAKLMEHLGEVSAEERAFVQAEMSRGVDAKALAAEVPPGLEQQVYTMSLLAIDLDSQAEAQHLHDLASSLGLDAGTVNALHGQLGAPALYR